MKHFDLFISQLTEQLKKPLPGEEVQFEMAHVKRERLTAISHQHYKESAVLILLYPNETNDYELVLIERPTYDGPHSAQMALPGGKKEVFDNDLKATALREFKEETGCLESPEIIGSLTALYIPVSQYVVYPFIAHLHFKPAFFPDEKEVKQLITLPLNQLLNPTIIKETILKPTETLSIQTPYFDIQQKMVWGATAMILNEFKAILTKL